MPDSRIAILVGLRSYPKLGKLDTPYQDVATLRSCLSKLGFEVIELGGASPGLKGKREILHAIEAARQKLLQAPINPERPPIALFYFSGHGGSHQGRNFIFSDEFDPSDPTCFALQALEIEREVAAELSVRSDVQVVALVDACRNEMRTARATGQGFVPPSVIPGRSLFGFSTQLGQPAWEGNAQGQSPYSMALKTHLPTQGVSISDILDRVSEQVERESDGQQRPTFTSSGLRFTLNPVPSSQSTPSPKKKPRTAYTDEEVGKLGSQIYKFSANDSTGRRAYYFLLVDPDFAAQFERNLSGDGMIDVEDYGVVIASNYGNEPSREVTEYLKERYGFNIAPKTSTLQTTISPRITAHAPAHTLFPLRRRFGNTAWHHMVVAIPPEKLQQFSAHGLRLRKPKGLFGLSLPPFDTMALAAYGTILYSSTGKDLPPKVAATIEASHNTKLNWMWWNCY